MTNKACSGLEPHKWRRMRVGLLAVLIVGFVAMAHGTSSAEDEDLAGILREIHTNMVEIPSGTYMMWATPGPHTEPGHLVQIESFFFSRYEVTQKQYKAIMGSNPSYFKDHPDLPVEQVSWQDCREFIKRLNAFEGNEAYRLPTEAEWEYACLADSGNDSGFCSTHDDLIEYAWYEANSEGRTHPVGQLKMNPWGLYDIHGNVWEWCQDWHGRHPSLSLTGPEGVATAFRIVRGGAWDSPEGNCRSHTRRSYSPTRERLNSIGFRLAKTIPIGTKAQGN